MQKCMNHLSLKKINNIFFRHKKTAIKRFIVYFTSIDDQVGALREIRTPDPLVRSQVLYPAEL